MQIAIDARREEIRVVSPNAREERFASARSAAHAVSDRIQTQLEFALSRIQTGKLQQIMVITLEARAIVQENADVPTTS